MTATSQHTASVELTVGQVAQTFGVTVRTLHHYDAQGLVVPSARTPSGYRLYTDADLSRLAGVVTYRRLGLPGGRRSRHRGVSPRRPGRGSGSH